MPLTDEEKADVWTQYLQEQEAAIKAQERRDYRVAIDKSLSGKTLAEKEQRVSDELQKLKPTVPAGA